MPAPESEERHGGQQRRDTYDWAVFFVAVLALVAAAVAAWFTWEQAAIARDNEQRALRAYVVIEAEMGTAAEGRHPVIWFKAENMGQTPVYDLSYHAEVSRIRRGYEELPLAELMRIKCPMMRGEGLEAFSVTFSKSHTYGRSISSDARVKDIPDVFQDGHRVYAYGTACYRDIFDAWHAYHFCYVWHNAAQGVLRCKTGAQHQR